MSARHRSRPARRRSTADLGTLPRRSAAQAGPLVLVAVLVALVVALASAVPRAVARVADDAVHAAVERAGTDADVVVTTRSGFVLSESGHDPDPAAGVVAAADDVAAGLRTRLGDVLRPYAAATTTPPLELAVDTPTPGETTVRLVWTHDGDQVEWTSGAEPGGPSFDVATDRDPEPEPVQVGLSEEVARSLGAATGDVLQAAAADGSAVDLRVSGLFRPVDPEAAHWRDVDDLLRPRVATVGPATSTRVAALLSDASLATALVFLDPGGVQRTVRLAFDPGAVGVAEADRVLAELPAAQASPAQIGWGAAGAALHSSAAGVLRGALADLAAARAASAALVAGAVAVGALLLVLTSGLLARRRAAELATRRTRGASSPGTAVELGVEALVVVAAGTGAGLLLAGAVVPGPVPLGTVLVVGTAAVLALVVAALRTAHPRTGGADPGGARPRGGVRDVRGRRLAAELTLLALAGAAAVTLGAAPGTVPAGRGRGGAAPAASPDLLAAATPVLLAAAGAVLVARALPALLRRLGPAASRSRRAVPVLAVARARSDGLAALPLLTVATAAALVVVGASSAAAVRHGQDAAAWRAVGGDVRVQGDADARLTTSAADWAAAPGVTVAVAVRVAEDVPARTADGSVRLDVVAGDPDALAALAAATPPDTRAGAAAAAGAVPAGEVQLRWDGQDRTVHAIAGLAVPAPATGRAEGRAVVAVDVEELGGADAVPPTTVWLVGPGAADAVRAAPPGGEADVVDRATVLAGLRADVLPRALVGAAVASVALLLALVVLAVLVTAATGGPARRRALDVLRTVGLTDREARWVAAGEVLPGALLATAAGAALGCAVALVVLGPLGLAGDAGAGTALVAWPAVALPVLAGALAGAAVLQVEHARRRTHRLGQVLRTSA
ncbi:FtsX-like permease family protein [Cellulomonas sp. Marseille-Q8402]